MDIKNTLWKRSYIRYVCYNEEIGNRELCPFVVSDTHTSAELPDARRRIWERKLHDAAQKD